MKRFTTLLILPAFFFVANSAKAQVFVNGNNISADSSVQFVEVTTSGSPAIFYIHTIDIGKGNIYRTKFTNETGKKKKFKTNVEFIQYMKSNGWELKRRDVAEKSNHFLLFERISS